MTSTVPVPVRGAPFPAPIDGAPFPAPIDGAPLPAYLQPQPDRFTAFLTRVANRTPRWVGPLAAAGAIGAAVAYTTLVRPGSVYAATHPTCIVRILTGFDCPGCGGTRSAWYLMHGDLVEAARHHAPFVFVVPFLMYMYVAWALKVTFGWRVPQLTLSTRSIMFFMAVWAVFSVLRNLPWAPFTWFYV